MPKHLITKKIVPYLLLFVVIFGTLAPAIPVLAQNNTLDIPLPAFNVTLPDIPPPTLVAPTRAVDLGTPDQRTTAPSSPVGDVDLSRGGGKSPQQRDAEGSKEPSKDVEFKFDCISVITPDLVCFVAQGSIMGLKYVGGSALLLGSMALDVSIEQTIVKSRDYFNNEGIKSAWSILRDLANIFFIFILLFIGIVTILQTTKSEYKQLLRNLIIMALLVNFSFFFTQVVIDISNVAATEIYQEVASDGLSNTFLDQLKLQSIFDAGSFAEETRGKGDVGKAVYGKIIIIGIFGTILFLIIAFIFIATAILLVSRVVILSFLLAASPLAFAAFVLPATVKYFRMWGEKLIANAFFAPIYLLGVFLSLEMMVRIPKSGENVTFATALLSKEVSNIGIIFDFMIIAGFMIASLIIAKQIGAFGASAIASMGDRARKGVQGALLRQTVGRFGAGLGHLGRGLKTVPYVGRIAGAPLTAVGDYAAAAKFGTDKGYKEAKTAKISKITGEAKTVGEEFGVEAKRRYAAGKTFGVLPGFAKRKAKGAILQGRDIKKLEQEEKYNKRTGELNKEYDNSLTDENRALNTIMQGGKAQERINNEIDANGDREELKEINENLTRLVALERKNKKLTNQQTRERRTLNGKSNAIHSKAIQSGADKLIKEAGEGRMNTGKKIRRRDSIIADARRAKKKAAGTTMKRKESASEYATHIGKGRPLNNDNDQEKFDEEMERYQEEHPVERPPTS